MADIKKLGIFGNNTGLDKMKEELAKKEAALPKEKKQSVTTQKNAFNEEKPKNVETKNYSTQSKPRINSKTVGAPIRKFDRIYTAKQSLKLSAILNSTSKILVEKYVTGMSRDELLRAALDDFIRQNLSQEDKLDLFNDLQKEMDLFRNSKKENMTVAEEDEEGNIIRSIEEIEKESELDIIKNWGINRKK